MGQQEYGMVESSNKILRKLEKEGYKVLDVGGYKIAKKKESLFSFSLKKLFAKSEKKVQEKKK